MDQVRQTILQRAKELGVSLAELSREIGKNHAYLQQYIHRGVPRELDEFIRPALAKRLGIDEIDLLSSEQIEKGTTGTAQYFSAPFLGRGPADPLIQALIDRLPAKGPWPIEDRIDWLQILVTAFQLAYGRVEEIDIKKRE